MERGHGHLCPACAEAIEEVGSVGWSARSRAVRAYVERTRGEKPAERLRSMLTEEFPPALPEWDALSLRPSVEPWEHLRRVIDRL